MSEKTLFMVNDVCDFNGMKVEVVEIFQFSTYTIAVENKKIGLIALFTHDGRYKPDGEICLKLIDRPKKKIKKRFWIWDVRDSLNQIFKTDLYLDDLGKTSIGDTSYPSKNLFRKHENEFIDIEVEE